MNKEKHAYETPSVRAIEMITETIMAASLGQRVLVEDDFYDDVFEDEI